MRPLVPFVLSAASTWLAASAALALDPSRPEASPEAPPPAVATFRRQVEEDWIEREAYRSGEPLVSRGITTREDASGGCDGVKDGRWGFHTGLDSRPWWQVDLGHATELDRVAVWNRCDGATERAFELEVHLSLDGSRWETAYRHDGRSFLGAPDGTPLVVDLAGQRARLVRIALPSRQFLHLDEVEVFARGAPARNVALGRPADQSSTSLWSHRTATLTATTVDWPGRTAEILERCGRRIALLRASRVDVAAESRRLEALRRAASQDGTADREAYCRARWLQRRLALLDPTLDFDAILFTQRVPGSFNHMSDQYLGWWSRPGGGLSILRDIRSDAPTVESITDHLSLPPGSFLRPDLSPDGRRVLFAWCRHHPALAAEPNKLDKANVPEDAFYHLFEVGLDGSGLRQLTRGKYDDFDGRYLPDGRIVFLSTRRGQSIQCDALSGSRTAARPDLPDIYVRCGGGPERPCVVYTLHTMDADGGDIRPISPFEMFEWTPSVGRDGTILYSRWDYIDRDNMPYMSLWSIRPDGTNARSVFANFTHAPHCTFEPRCVPGSRKIVFTASAHHQQTKGSLVLLDPAVGDEGEDPMTRLTPEVAFPEAEGWPLTSYANPWPLSERLHLVAWGAEGAMAPGPAGWARWHAVDRPANGMGLYLFEADGNMELLHRDPEISSVCPIPLAPRGPAPVLASTMFPEEPATLPETPELATVSEEPAPEEPAPEGRFFLTDVYRGLDGVRRGAVKALRIVAVPPKTHPTMNYPSLGVTRDDPGKCVLGTAPVEADGSAYFRVPAGVIVFFQALDEEGMAIQTMRSVTHVQEGSTLGCVGCHERRQEAPPASAAIPLALRRAPSPLRPGPEGSWPLRFDRLVAPVVERRCVSCHRPEGDDPDAARLDLTADRAWNALVSYGSPSLADHVRARYRAGRSTAGECAARRSVLRALLDRPEGHHGVRLDAEERERLIVWMDTYAQRLGSFGEDQERRLIELRERCWRLLAAKDPATGPATGPAGEPTTLERRGAQ